MVEAGAKEAPEEIVIEAMEKAHDEIKKIISFQREFKEIAGKDKKETDKFVLNVDVEKRVRELVEEKIQRILD